MVSSDMGIDRYTIGVDQCLEIVRNTLLGQGGIDRHQGSTDRCLQFCRDLRDYMFILKFSKYIMYRKNICFLYVH